MSTAFVLGNGKSRLGVDLNKLKTKGRIYGCNALYREFSPDVLIATDRAISEEIQRSGYPKKHTFYTRIPKQGTGAKRIEFHYGFSSGPIAMAYAIHEGAKAIYMLGFDYAGVKGMFSNVYENTKFYKKTSDKETFYGNWVNQCKTVIEHNPKLTFVRVIRDGILVPKDFKNLKNLRHIDMAEFLKTINI